MLQGTGQAVRGGTRQEDHEESPCGGDRSEQPDAAIQSRDLQNSPRYQPHDRRGRPRRNGQDRFGKAYRRRTDDEIY